MKTVVWILALVATLANAQNGMTKFEKCAEEDSDTATPCVKTQLTKVSATMVEDSVAGDAITLQLCSDLQTTDCCSLAPISEFKANQTVVIEADKFADCKDKTFTIRRGLTLTATKTTPDLVIVDVVVIDTKNPDPAAVDPEEFRCYSLVLGGTEAGAALNATQRCTLAYDFVRLRAVESLVGDKGSTDEVKLKVCSDVEPNPLCCEQPLVSSDPNAWKENTLNIWHAVNFTECAKDIFKIIDEANVWVSKTGAADLNVTRFGVSFDLVELDIFPTTLYYNCDGFMLQGDCSAAPCVHKLENCIRSASSQVVLVSVDTEATAPAETPAPTK